MKTLLIATALTAAQLPTPATANPDVKRRDVPVAIADLDLSTAAGMAALERRLAKAIAKACGTAYYLDAQQVNEMERCRVAARVHAETLRDAVVARHVAKAGFNRAASR